MTVEPKQPELVQEPCIQVAIAILYQDNQFLLQLRDDKPQIRYPGQWAFFGGHLEPDEYPEVGLMRELLEEIGYCPPCARHFRSYGEKTEILRHVFSAPLEVEITTLELNEGMDLGLCSIEAIQRGYLYSQRIGKIRPISSPHRQILLDFLQSGI